MIRQKKQCWKNWREKRSPLQPMDVGPFWCISVRLVMNPPLQMIQNKPPFKASWRNGGCFLPLVASYPFSAAIGLLLTIFFYCNVGSLHPFSITPNKHFFPFLCNHQQLLKLVQRPYSNKASYFVQVQSL